MFCWYYNTKEGCRNGELCPYKHKKKESSQVPLCRNYKGPGTCRYGDRCFFRHEDEKPEKVVKSTKQSSPAEARCDGAEMAAKPKVYKSSHPVGGASVSCDDDKENENGVRKTENRKKKKHSTKSHKTSPKSQEKYLSIKIDNKVTGDSTHVKTAQIKVDQLAGAEDGNNNAVAIAAAQDDEGANQNTVEKTVFCGECGLLLQDTILAGDELDELEKHYKENILKMEKCHIKFLEKDPRFKYSTSCIVCGKSFMKSFSLLCHITDKIKSKKNDWKAHDDFLEGMITSFWERDIGVTEESECMDGLLLHLVESFEGEDTDTDDDEEIGGINKLFRMMKLNRKLHGDVGSDEEKDDEDSSGSNSFLNPWGMDEEDMYELACQGIKPWDSCAVAALSVLNGDDYF